MQNGRLIGYARVDTVKEVEALRAMTDLLYGVSSCDVFTDIGPITGTLDGLLDAVSKLQIGDVLIFPEDCLRNLTVGDLPKVFRHTPDRTTLSFFERFIRHEQLSGVTISGIRLNDESEYCVEDILDFVEP
jgi:hypothetical protein